MRRLLFPHLALWVLGAALVRIALIPPEVCPPVGAGEITTAAVAASDWIDRGTGADGRYTYGYLKDVESRVPGFLLGDAVLALLALGSLYGIGRSLLAG